MSKQLLLSIVVACIVILHGQEVLVWDDLAQHDILVVLVDSIFFTLLSAVGILHVLEPLPLEKNVELVVFDFHDVWTLAVDEHDPIRQL